MCSHDDNEEVDDEVFTRQSDRKSLSNSMSGSVTGSRIRHLIASLCPTLFLSLPDTHSLTVARVAPPSLQQVRISDLLVRRLLLSTDRLVCKSMVCLSVCFVTMVNSYFLCC